MEQATQQAAAGGGTPGDLQALLSLQMLKELKRMNKKRTESDDSDADSDDDLAKGGSRLRGVVRLRRRCRRRPLSLLKKYTLRVRRCLGAEDPRRAWRYADYSMKILPAFGRMRGLWRCHWIMSEALESLVRDNKGLAIAWLVQGCKALHQVGLDGGAWWNAQHMLPSQDPLMQEDWGGEPEELLATHSYQKAIADLHLGRPSAPGGKGNRQQQGQQQQNRAEEGEDGHEGGEAAPKRRSRR